MADEKLQNFKVSDRHKPRVDKGGKKIADKEMAHTMGFARIEELLDKEPPGVVGQNLARLLDSLAAYEAEGTTPKHRAAAKKARAAVEKTIDLLDYLFRTKEALQAQGAAAEKK
jgi:hypothetical protein